MTTPAAQRGAARATCTRAALTFFSALECPCARGGEPFEACLDDPACAQILRCASVKSCLGVSCYHPQLCAADIDAGGGPLRASAQQAIAVADCLGAAACDPCAIPAR